MDLFNGYATVLLWTITTIDCQRWYSATVENELPAQMLYFGIPKAIFYPTLGTRTPTLQDNEHSMRLPLLNNNEINTWQPTNGMYIKQLKTPKMPSKKLISKDSMKFETHHKQKSPKDPPIMMDIRKNWTPIKKANSTNSRSIRIDRTVNKINLMKKVKPRRKIIRNRCPVTRQRQRKQLNLNATSRAKSRFLEVFEVVEFDHVACVASSGLEGVCLPESECQNSGAVGMGSCADGYGTCCVTQFSCEDRSAAPAGWFTSPRFPSPSTERLSCAMTLDKVSNDVQQIRLDFQIFELLPPTGGSCEQDQFMVTGQNVNNIIPLICGVNTGQHLYIEVGNVVGPITLSVQTVSSDSRLFSIRVTQLTPADELAAPPGCLQYFKEPQGYLESFNYRDKSDIAIARTPSYLNNLNYAMCIERAPGICSVTYTNTGYLQIVNYDADGLPVIPPGQAGVEIFNCPTDWMLIAAVRLCGDRLNDGSVHQDFALDAPVTDNAAGPIVVWFRSDGGYAGKGFKLQYQQNNC